ncbi:alpha/beta hydrolase [Leifsonia sp. A12D58]|uniref:alpha/beta hydrolase n=1 Tax=Leifsonia sp. A12D58 TaxID=3397674 RepID=UPI0039DFFDF7
MPGLLLDVATVLTASLALMGVREDIGARAQAVGIVATDISTRVSDRPGDGVQTALWLNVSADLGASVAVDLNSLRSVSGLTLVAGLSKLPTAEISAFVAKYPEQVDTLLANPPAAARVSALWNSFTATSRASLVSASPRLVGNLDGVPLKARGEANMRYLTSSLADVKSRLATSLPSDERARATTELAVLTQVQQAVRTRENGSARTLVLLDLTDGGRAAIAIGNPDTATFVSYLIPGMNYNVVEQIVNWSNTAEDLFDEQRAVLAETDGSADADADAQTVATVAWIGYETPTLFTVGGLDNATRGAELLENDWLGLQSSRGLDRPRLSVFAHSYGSTVALATLARGTVRADALVLVGSPGSPVQSVDSLDVPKQNVYVGEADWDPAVDSAFFGADPGDSSFGAKALGVSGATDRLTGDQLAGSFGHNDYFTPGSESLRNMALIGTDNAELVTTGSE